ncbi:hypothetical protein [Streptomyces viridochromogenes]|uniref:hypothetical protein n=1 Tax=Streptomyces viridochromogenes TaxID=1938 RepID=UPI00069D8991|nr:hypothetical protein [Streptomyces viridochromogenes]KOG09255.1 hypothetical protein ADK36_41325 [Streptomyces viridochromogenes]KOG25307.1 hypothetical protein ADK35_09695 [Streptomyces viridochromogenes]
MLELDSPPSATAPASRVPLDRYARWAGLAVGILATRWLLPLNNGEGALYAILTFGLCAVAGVLLGDVLTAPRRGAVRTAGLTPRRVRDYVPPRMTVLLLGLAAALIVLLITAASVASRDDLGRAGRAFTVTCGGVTHSHTPWPGLYYGLPVLASLALSTAACGWSLRRIATRPGDEQSRRDRALAIVAAWGLVVSSALFGVASTVSGALMSTTCDGAAGVVGNWTVWPLGLLALLTAPWCLFTIVSPRATVWRGRRSGTSGTGRR